MNGTSLFLIIAFCVLLGFLFETDMTLSPAGEEYYWYKNAYSVLFHKYYV